MATRKAISKRIRFEVFKRDSFKCQYCGVSAPDAILHVDHIHPVSRDGDNDMMNLITACSSCNGGKSNRLLDDDSAVTKQKLMLDEINQRREQLQQMLKWRNELSKLKDETIDIAADAFGEKSGYSPNEKGRSELKKLIDRFGMVKVLDAIEESGYYMKKGVDSDVFTHESAQIAWNKIGGICRLSDAPDYKKSLYYIRGISRNRHNYCNQPLLMKKLEEAYQAGVDIEDLKSAALTTNNWTAMMNQIDALMGVVHVQD